jgi:hypothetical protein
MEQGMMIVEVSKQVGGMCVKELVNPQTRELVNAFNHCLPKLRLLLPPHAQR